MYWISVDVWGQVDTILFTNLTIRDGLSNPSVNCILQDHQGFMWFGTDDGLNRYDGYSFRVYKHSLKDTNSLSSNRVTSLYEDNKHILWIGTTKGGLNRYDPVTDSFNYYKYNPKDSTTLSDNDVNAILEDHTGNLWIGTGSGLNRLNSDSRSFRRYYPGNAISDSTSRDLNNYIFCLLEDEGERLWFGTQEGLYCLDRLTNHLQVFRPNSVDRRNADIRDANNDIISIARADQQNLWIGTSEGLKRFNKRTLSFETFPCTLGSISVNPHVKKMIYHEKHLWWIATGHQGLELFDDSTGQCSFFHHDANNPHSILLSQNARSIYRDRTGAIWVGMENGVSRIDHRKHLFSFQPLPKDAQRNTVFNVYDNPMDGKVYLDTGDGLYEFDPTQEIFSYYQLAPSGKSMEIDKMYCDRQGVMWIITTEGLYQFDLAHKRFHPYQHPVLNSLLLKDFFLVRMNEDARGNLWVSSYTGLYQLDRSRKQCIHWKHENDSLHSLAHDIVGPIMEDRQGNVWICNGNWLSRLKVDTGEFIHFKCRFHAVNVVGLVEDTLGNIWLASLDEGLFRIEINKRTLNITEVENLPDNKIRGMVKDHDGNLLLSTLTGLTRFDPVKRTVHHYDERDGAPANFQRFGFFGFDLSYTGNILIGGYGGFTYFQPKKPAFNPYQPPVVLTSFKVFDRELKIGRSINFTDTIQLSYGQNFFTLEFAALNFTMPEKNQYAYQLVGLDKDWNYSGSRRFASYTNIEPGKYIFRVKASNNDGLWNEKGVCVLILIHPPWWRTKGALIIYYLMIGAGLVMARRSIKRRERMRADLRVQQLEADQLRDLDTMKSRFFANLSHEFRTPLALISGSLEQLKPSPEQTSGFATIQRYSHRLLQLINQLLDLSKLEAGQLQPHPQAADVTGLLRTLASSFESLAESRGIAYRYALPLQPQWASFDADKLEKILTNLLSNALKFTPAGGQVVFSASLEEVTSSNCLLRLTVEDSGIGIPDQQLPHIFERFYQVDASTTRAHEGTGIGLALTRELVELLKGSIQVKSQLADATHRSGTTFTVHLPLALLAEPADLPSAVSQESPAEDYLETTHQQFTQLSRHPERVLVVEDNADLRHFLSECLANRYSVLEAADGQQGLQKALETIPDLVISDVMMPGLDGMSLCERLKSDERTCHIPVILLTAKTDSKLQGLQLGADDHLGKPFQVEELRLRVDNLIAQRKRLREKYARQVVMQPKAVEATSPDERFLQKALTVMEAQLGNADFDVKGFSRELGMSRAQLQRKLAALTGQGPNELMRRFRLQRAADLLQHRQGNVGEVALSVGFSNLNYFTRCFREHFGKTPSEYLREVANKDAL